MDFFDLWAKGLDVWHNHRIVAYFMLASLVFNSISVSHALSPDLHWQIISISEQLTATQFFLLAAIAYGFRKQGEPKNAVQVSSVRMD